MAVGTREEHQQFENDVRRIARQLWPDAQFGGAELVGGKERDGVFETEESVHLIEATTSRRKAKAEEDCKKLGDLSRSLERKQSDKSVRRWFITREEPTADQRGVAQKYRVTTMSFSQFQSRLIDSKTYLAARDQYYFGSIRDPGTGKATPSVDFIPLTLSSVMQKQPSDLGKILSGISSGGRVVVLGDFGAGKSMTLRHFYQELRRAHLRGDSPKFPVFINLRDHYGQSDPAELIERHARVIGFERPSHLVRAWRSGYVHLLLDGFDETTSLSMQGLWTKLRDNRYRAMEIVRRIAREHPSDSGLVLAGRAHFFDSHLERRRALGLTGDWEEYSLNEFTDEQISLYLQRAGLSGTVPNWLPSRPLLVAYLGSKGLLSEVVNDRGADPAAGWDILLNNIASREAQIEAGIEGDTIRQILERLATRARSAASGLGPLSPSALVDAFLEVCGYTPDDRAMVLLQRLPGLGADDYEDGSRAFIDEEFADACRAGDVVRFAESPFQFPPGTFSRLEIVTGALGIAVATRQALARGLTAGQANAAVRRAETTEGPVFLSDIVSVTLGAGHDIAEGVMVRGALIPEFELSPHLGDASLLEFQECFFTRLDIDSDVAEDRIPKFRSCFIAEVDGRVSRADLPSQKFDQDCIIESFAAAAATTSEVLSLDLPLGTKVLLTILKKLFDRPGSGRKESALYRGLDQRAQGMVPNALRAIQREGLATPVRRGSETIWLPDRGSLRRVGQMVAAPVASNDRLLETAADF